jgi:hypothetical protein
MVLEKGYGRTRGIAQQHEKNCGEENALTVLLDHP